MTNGEVVLTVPNVALALIFGAVAAAKPAAGAITAGVSLLIGFKTWWLYLRANAYSRLGRWPYLASVTIAAGAVLGIAIGFAGQFA